MGYSVDNSHVYAMVFSDVGKWKYDVCLDYSFMNIEMGEDNSDAKNAYFDWNLWNQARRALREATEKSISGVTFKEIPPGWFMIVPEPVGKSAHPICVRNKD